VKLTWLVGQGRKDTAYSIDRIVPTLGYIKGNIQIISELANRMKSNASVEQLLTFAQGILKLHAC